MTKDNFFAFYDDLQRCISQSTQANDSTCKELMSKGHEIICLAEIQRFQQIISTNF